MTQKRSEVLDMIARDMQKDAIEFDGRPFNGKTVAEYELESSPVFDGMIAARSRIFISLQDGSLVCFGK